MQVCAPSLSPAGPANKDDFTSVTTASSAGNFCFGQGKGEWVPWLGISRGSQGIELAKKLRELINWFFRPPCGSPELPAEAVTSEIWTIVRLDVAIGWFDRNTIGTWQRRYTNLHKRRFNIDNELYCIYTLLPSTPLTMACHSFPTDK